MNIITEPNKAMEGMRLLVTASAFALPAPSNHIPHLERSAGKSGHRSKFSSTLTVQPFSPIHSPSMSVIHLQTVIYAPIERVFDLARSIDAHQDTAKQTSERAVAGVTSGLLGPEEEVTWEARHFGVKQRLRVKMTKFERPNHFQDVMLEGAFRHMKHDHSFEDHSGKTIMIDRFEFSSPLGFIGRIVDCVFLESYMRRFIVKRNAILKHTAESHEWMKYIKVVESTAV